MTSVVIISFSRYRSLAAKDRDGHRLETVELNVKTWKVIQSRALQNGTTKYHDQIVKLVEKNMNLIKRAKSNKIKAAI